MTSMKVIHMNKNYLYTSEKKKELQFYIAEGLQCLSLQTYLNMYPKNWTGNQNLL